MYRGIEGKEKMTSISYVPVQSMSLSTGDEKARFVEEFASSCEGGSVDPGPPHPHIYLL